MGLRDVESTLPPGFRFYPSDEELVCHYLYKKVANVKNYEGTMVEVDLHTREPWELPDVAKLSDDEWYFFSFRDRKYATGLRTNRATKSGYWKATGKDRTINHPKTCRIVGMRKTLVFYSGRAPNGIKTAWVMHEFRLESPHTPPKEDWVLCRVFHKRKAEVASSSSIENLESSPRLVDPPSTMPQGSCSDTMGSLHYSFIDFPQEMGSMGMMGMEMGMGMGMEMGSKDGGVDDGYGFILDVGLDGMGAKGIPGVNDIRF